MGFTKPYLPDVDPDTFLKKPLMERMRILATDWAENGFGSPKMIHTIYIVKLVVFFAIGGITVATLTSGLPAFWHVSEWWNQPIVYQKVILWTVLLEAIGVAGSWGPLAGKVKPMTGGILFWARPGTIRLRPWKWVPFTNGDRRTWFDIAVYLALLVSLAVPLLSPGVHSDSLSKALPHNTSGMVNPALLIAPIALLVLIGLRDKTIFLAARGEQYLPVLVIFAVLPFVNMIIALKMVIVVVWVGAGFSKFGKHFSNVIPPMVSNTIFAPKWVRRAHYRDFGRDMRPSRLADFMAHVNGTTVEILAPLVLFFSTNKWVTLAAALLMVGFHLFIISTFPLAVPLEWNVVFAYTTVFLFLGFPNWNGYAPWNMTPPWLAFVIAAALLFYPVLGNLRPDKVSFLPSMRQYAGNWASAVWTFAPGSRAEAESGHPLGVQPARPVRRGRLRAAVGRDHPAEDDRVAKHAQPGSRPVLAAADPPARRRRPHGARGRVRLQLADRLQLRRRPPAQCGHDPGRAARSRIRAGRVRRRLGGVGGLRQRCAALPADRRRARGDRARHLEGGRRGRRAALAAQRPHPD